MGRLVYCSRFIASDIYFLFSVFICTHLKRTSCNIYLAALATSDTAFLLCVFLSWCANIYNRNGWCQTLVYLTYVTSFLSVWYIVAFTTERFIVVCFPNKRRKVCTPQVAQAVVVFLTCFAFTFYSFAPVVTGVSTFYGVTICAPMLQFIKVTWIMDNLDTLLTLLVPVIIILGCNIKIATLVCTFYKGPLSEADTYLCRWEFTGQTFNNNLYEIYNLKQRNSSATVLDSNKVYSTRSKLGSSNQMKATRMLLIVSTVFLVCNLPTHVARCYAFIMNMIDDSFQPTRNFILCQKLFNFLYYINFAVNFFLYSFSSRNFRLGFRRLIVKIKSRLISLCRTRKRVNHRKHVSQGQEFSHVLHSYPLMRKEAEATL